MPEDRVRMIGTRALFAVNRPQRESAKNAKAQKNPLSLPSVLFASFLFFFATFASKISVS